MTHGRVTTGVMNMRKSNQNFMAMAIIGMMTLAACAVVIVITVKLFTVDM